MVRCMALTPEQRTAQRKIVGMLNLKSGMWFEPTGDFCIWRDDVASEWGGGIPEVSAHFDVLEIPYLVRIEQINTGKQKKAGFTLVVHWDDLPSLTRWAPSFQKQIDGVKGQIITS